MDAKPNFQKISALFIYALKEGPLASMQDEIQALIQEADGHPLTAQLMQELWETLVAIEQWKVTHNWEELHTRLSRFITPAKLELLEKYQERIATAQAALASYNQLVEDARELAPSNTRNEDTAPVPLPTTIHTALAEHQNNLAIQALNFQLDTARVAFLRGI